MVVICDISAWEYHRTPPMLRDAEVDVARVLSSLPETFPGPVRANAREADLLVRDRLFGELKGLTLPVSVYVDHYSDPRHCSVTRPRALPRSLTRRSLIDLGGGLFVLSPEATMCMQGHRLGRCGLAKIMFEACGIFSTIPDGAVLKLAIGDLVDRGLLAKEAFAGQGIYGFSDTSGTPYGEYAPSGARQEWVPCFDRRGKLTDMWKRPALTSVEKIGEELETLGCPGKNSWKRKALAMVSDGAASPAEVYAHMMLASGVWNGGESWGGAFLNREIVFTPEAATLANATHCYADMLWPEKGSVLEVQGEAFHADEDGFHVVTGRTPALESMGYAVGEITVPQMRNLEVFDTLVETLARKLGMPIQHRSAAFLKRRDLLHEALFGMPFEP